MIDSIKCFFFKSTYNDIVLTLLFLFICKSVVYLKIVSMVECFFLKPFCSSVNIYIW